MMAYARIVITMCIYHNIRYQHPLTGPQRNSGASEPFPAHFLTRIPEKRPDDFCATAWLCTRVNRR